jgi:hypothetical protein
MWQATSFFSSQYSDARARHLVRGWALFAKFSATQKGLSLRALLLSEDPSRQCMSGERWEDIAEGGVFVACGCKSARQQRWSDDFEDTRTKIQRVRDAPAYGADGGMQGWALREGPDVIGTDGCMGGVGGGTKGAGDRRARRRGLPNYRRRSVSACC